MKTPRFVPQFDTYGCGPACIAMVAPSFSRSRRRAYEQAVQVMFPPDQRTKPPRTDWSDLKDALRSLGVEHAAAIRSCKEWNGIQALAIVKCGVKEFQDKPAEWHWVAYDGRTGLLYDPGKGKSGPSRPDGRFRQPRSYLSMAG